MNTFFDTNAAIVDGQYGKYEYNHKTGDYEFTSLGNAIYIERITSNIETGKIRLLLSFEYLKKVKQISIDRKLLSEYSLIEILADVGADVTKKNFDIIVDTLRMQEKEMMNNNVQVFNEYDHLGWIEVPICDDDGNEIGKELCYRAYRLIGKVPYKEKGAIKGSYIGPYKVKPMGSYKAWKKLVKDEVLGHIALEVVLLAGLSAIVNGLISTSTTNENPIFHIYGLSGTGKSTAAILAASVFGEAFHGTKIANKKSGTVCQQSIYSSWGSTENALIASCAGNRGAAIILNELGKFKGTDLSSAVYNFSEGTDKHRLNKELHPSISEGYSTAFISVGELSLLECCKKKENGLYNRVMEIDDVLTDSADHSKRITSGCKANNGWASIALAHHIIQEGGKEYVLKIFNQYNQKLKEKWPDTPNKERFIEKFAALLLTTAELTKRSMKLSFDKKALTNYLISYDQKHGQKRNSVANSFECVVEYCRVHSSNFYQDGKLLHPLYAGVRSSRNLSWYRQIKC